jgi:hypothetical protein
LRRLGLGDTVNDCWPPEMFPPEKTSAEDFIKQRALENGIHMNDLMATEILRLIDPHWYYPLQIFLTEIQVWSRTTGRDPQVADLEVIYRERLVAQGNENLKHMWSKLSEIFDASELRFARVLLKALSRDAAGFSRREMENLHTQTFPSSDASAPADFEFIIGVLKHDGYLIQDVYGEQRTRFASNLLRDYWMRKLS